jgi:hypothetical protein
MAKFMDIYIQEFVHYKYKSHLLTEFVWSCSVQYMWLENGTRVKNIGHITQIANKLIHLAHNQSHILVRLQVSFLYIHGTRFMVF